MSLLTYNLPGVICVRKIWIKPGLYTSNHILSWSLDPFPQRSTPSRPLRKSVYRLGMSWESVNFCILGPSVPVERRGMVDKWESRSPLKSLVNMAHVVFTNWSRCLQTGDTYGGRRLFIELYLWILNRFWGGDGVQCIGWK